MAWLPVDPQYAALAALPPLLALGLVAVVALFAFECARGRIALGWKAAVALPAATLAAAAGLAALARLVGAGAPAVDAWQPTVAGAGLAAGALAFPITLFALFLLFLWPVRRLRWPEAYFALAAGPGLAAVLLAAKVAWPRAPPASPSFLLGPMAFPNDIAALVPAAVGLGLFLRARVSGKRLRGGAAASVALASVAAVLLPVVAGQAHPTDALAGLLLAVAWLGLCLMGLLLAEGALSHRTLLVAALDVADAAARRAMANATPWLLGLIGIGVALRIASYWWMPLAVDTFSYSAIAHSLLTHGSLTMPWGDVDTFLTAPVPSHHYPPLYPIYLAAFYKVLGFSQATAHVASIASSLAALLAVWLCTRDLYGPRPALLTTAIAAISPLLVQNTGQGYSENLVLLLFVATLWAILKSLKSNWYILPAGILAGLGYLTKSSMGYFFIIAGLGGLAWRLYWKGWKVLRDPAYVMAILAFGAMAGAWALRNYALFGSWETSQHISDAYHYALGHPVAWLLHFLVTFVFYTTAGYLLYLAVLPWLPHLVRLPKLDSEHDSGLWLALGLPLVLTSAIDAALWLVEKEFFLNNARYISFVIVPIAWLLVRHVQGSRATRLALVATLALLLAGSLFFAKPSGSYTQDIANDWAPRIAPGDSVAFVDSNNHFAYRFYFQFTHGGMREVPVALACLEHPLCPATVMRPEALNTTWVLAPQYATSHLPTYYQRVPGAVADGGDPARPDLQVLWRHT